MPCKRRKIAHCVSRAAVQELNEGDLAVSQEIRSLVCDRCWSDFFGAPKCWVYCSTGREALVQQYDSPILEVDADSYPQASYQILRSQLVENVETCNWCSLIAFASTRMDEKCTGFFVELGPTEHPFLPPPHNTPAGRNHWGLSIGPQREPFGARGDQGEYIHLDAYTNPEDKAAKIVTARPVQENVDTDLAYNEIKAWLQACKRHSQCPSQKKVRLPTRVIDVGSRVNSKPKLYNTKGAAGRYAALSYCWGGSQHGALTQDNLQRYLTIIHMDDMSQTIKDAIKVVRAVGLRYLWVDALCILQDSETDKTHEIATMDQVYRKALFTISAEMAASARDGFLSPRKSPSAKWRIPHRLEDGTFGSIFLKEEDPETQTFFEPLQTRAWAFQETLLSSTLLIYNSQTLQWCCPYDQFNLGASYCRKYAASNSHLHTARNFHKMHERTSPGDWSNIVTEYTRREHSDPRDRLIALGGVAKVFSENRTFILQAESSEVKYVAGLWELQLIHHLPWFVSSCNVPRPLDYRAPSWSWASVDGPVSFQSTGQLACHEARVIECSTTCESMSAPFGAVRDGWLVIEGPMVRGRYQSSSNKREDLLPYFGVRPENNAHPAQHQTIEFGEIPIERWQVKLDSKDEPLENDADFLILKWRALEDPIHGLILQDLQNGNHVRVGMFWYSSVDDVNFSMQEIKINLPPLKRVRVV